MPDSLSYILPGAPGGAFEMIVPKSTIEHHATQAAAKGLTIDESCPYPFGTPPADHFKAVYLLALPLASDIRTRYAAKGHATTPHTPRCTQPRPGCSGQCNSAKATACAASRAQP